jgi:hypothetical protein
MGSTGFEPVLPIWGSWPPSKPWKAARRQGTRGGRPLTVHRESWGQRGPAVQAPLSSDTVSSRVSLVTPTAVAGPAAAGAAVAGPAVA